MTLQAVVDTLDDVPAQFRDLYVEHDGSYRLDVAGVEFPEDVRGLKSALEKEREAKREAKAKLAAFGDVDPREAQRMADLADARRGELEQVLERINKRHVEELSQLRDQLHERETVVERMLVSDAATRELQAAGGDVSLLLPHVTNRVQVHPNDQGRYEAVVCDERGVPRTRDDGTPLGIADLVREMSTDPTFRVAFKASTAAGYRNAAHTEQAGGPVFDVKSASVAEKVEYIENHGRQAYMDAIGVRKP